MRELVKADVPAPLLVLASNIVGEGVVAQQTPLLVIEAPPVEEIDPPETAEFIVIDVILLVKIFGVVKARVVKFFTGPYIIEPAVRT